MAIATGARLNHYEIIAPLGAGGMGKVYLAEDPRLGRQAAIKLLPAEFAGDSDRLRRFEQEARATSALNHTDSGKKLMAAEIKTGSGGFETVTLYTRRFRRERFGAALTGRRLSFANNHIKKELDIDESAGTFANFR